MNIRELVFTLRADTRAAIRGLLKADDAANRVGRSLVGINQRLSRAQDRVRQSSAGFQSAAVEIFGIVAALRGVVGQTIKFEDSLTDVKKVVDGLEDPVAFKQLRQDILALSTEIPISAREIASIVAAAGQAGINDLLPFTRAAARIGVAFDISAEQSGDALAKLRTSLGLSQPEVELLADGINELSNNLAANAGQVLNITTRIGAFAKQAGLSAEQTSALGAALVAAGAAPERAATGLRRLISRLSQGENATKAQQEAFQSLGLDAQDLSNKLQEDATGAIREVIVALGEVSDQERISTITSLFGAEGVDALAPLITNVDLYDKALKTVSNTSEVAGSAQGEFENRVKSTSAQLQIFSDSLFALSDTIVSVLLPPAIEFLNTLNPIIAEIAKFASENEELTKVIGGLVFGLLGLRVAVLGGGFLFTQLAGGAIALAKTFTTFISIISRIPAIFGAISAAARIMSLAISANPIGLAIAAIAAAIVAVVLAVRNFDSIVAFFTETLPNAVSSALDSLFGFAGKVLEPIQGAIDAFNSVAPNVFRAVTSPFRQAVDAVREFFADIVGNVAERINQAIRLFNRLPKVDIPEIEIGNLQGVGGGAQAFQSDAASSVNNNNVSVGGSSVSASVSVQVNGDMSPDQARRVGEQVGRGLTGTISNADGPGARAIDRAFPERRTAQGMGG